MATFGRLLMRKTKSKASRYCGILVHPTSFPSPYGIGDMGKGAYDFIDFLKKAGLTLWQCLPLGPTGFGDSPYQSFSSFAGQPLIISPDKLKETGLLTNNDLKDIPQWDPRKIDYGPAIAYKNGLLKKSYEHFKECTDEKLLSEYEAFCQTQALWLDDYALFMALKNLHNGQSWTQWENKYRFIKPRTRAIAEKQCADDIGYYKYIQFIFMKQWTELKAYANENGIAIIGDIPIFVSPDSADIWGNKHLFQLDSKGYPKAVAGVPPDYFSATGQLWGNPLYKWPEHKKDGYAWWTSRIAHQLELVDYLRIDHFRGFESYWSVPYGEETAINGKWIKGPGRELFDAIAEKLGDDLPIFAEDLGIITPEVEELRDALDFPGMKVLQFAFETTGESAFLPHQFKTTNCICYTGTHDNDTTRGWYEHASEASRDKVRRYMSCNGSIISWDFIRTAIATTAKYAIFPLQDLFGLDSSARMNTPGVAAGNWAWRYASGDLNDDTAYRLKETCILFGRTGDPDEKEEDKKAEDTSADSGSSKKLSKGERV